MWRWGVLLVLAAAGFHTVASAQAFRGWQTIFDPNNPWRYDIDSTSWARVATRLTDANGNRISAIPLNKPLDLCLQIEMRGLASGNLLQVPASRAYDELPSEARISSNSIGRSSNDCMQFLLIWIRYGIDLSLL